MLAQDVLNAALALGRTAWVRFVKDDCAGWSKADIAELRAARKRARNRHASAAARRRHYEDKSAARRGHDTLRAANQALRAENQALRKLYMMKLLAAAAAGVE